MPFPSILPSVPSLTFFALPPSPLLLLPPTSLQAQAASFSEHGGRVTSLACSENGYYLATGCEDGVARMWDLRKLAAVGASALPTIAPLTSVAFDGSGHYLAAGAATGAVAVWAAKDVAGAGTGSAEAPPSVDPLWSLPAATGAGAVTSLGWGPLARSLLVGRASGKAALQIFTASA